MPRHAFLAQFGMCLATLVALCCSLPASAATAVEVARCWTTYTALEGPFAQARHKPLAAYISARVANVRPSLLRLRAERASFTPSQADSIRDSKRAATQMVTDVSNAISRSDDGALRVALAPVIACDRVFGFTSFPLPKADASAKSFSPETIPPRPKDDPGVPPDIMAGYRDGFLESCVHGDAPTKYGVRGEAKISALCQCVLDASTGAAHNHIPTFLELDDQAEILYGNCAKGLRPPR
jgi:hypothetical protein